MVGRRVLTTPESFCLACCTPNPSFPALLIPSHHHFWWSSWEEHWPLSRSKASWGSHSINPFPFFLSGLSVVAHWLHQSEDSDVAYTNQPPGREMRVYNGRENASGRVGDRLLVRMVPILHSLCISTRCNLILQLCPSKCWVYFFIPWIWANLISSDPKIWWKGCCVISMPKRPHTLPCSLRLLPVTWEPALITSWEMECCFPLHACMHANSLHSCPALYNPFTVAHQAPLAVEFSKQKYWNGLPFPPPRDVPYPGIEAKSLTSPALAGGVFTISTIWEGSLEVVKDALSPAHKTTDHTCISDPSQD